MFFETKNFVSWGIGLVTIVLSLIPLLNKWGIIAWNLPSFLSFGSGILLWVVAGVGFYLLIDSFLSEDDMTMWLSAGIAAVIMIIAIIEILFNLGQISFSVPFLSLTFLQVLFLIEGIGIFIAGFGTK